MALKIALLGYGKMGQAIEAEAVARGHEVVARIRSTDAWDLHDADVVVEFTQPESAATNLKRLAELGKPVICGTTGWFQDLPSVEAAFLNAHNRLIYASNFSLGVQLAFQLNRQMAELLAPYRDQYRPSIEEVHHTAKKDAPSGTAISFAEGLLPYFPELKGWSLNGSQPGSLPITARREDPVPGTHTVCYESEIDRIELTHVAHNRRGFALGAVLASERIAQCEPGAHHFAKILF
ncbi:MAG: 4-hydroxy-tetrahydrodipicolinate reductase [Schleiferiaceae bacterium]|jgi:4-hydroxy-tetrahydrodipicolinate reductase